VAAIAPRVRQLVHCPPSWKRWSGLVV
jgi:hypothetical protein